MDSDKFKVIERYNNRYIDDNDEYADSSKNIIVLLMGLIIIGLLYLMILGKNEWFSCFLEGYIVDFVDKLVNLGYYLSM